MGFGILFLGYIFTVFDTGILFIDSISSVFMQAFRLLGWFLVAIGSYKLSHYIDKFYYARIAAVSLVSICLADTACHVMTVYLSTPIAVWLRTAIFILYAAAYFLFHYYSFGGFADVTADTGLEKENKRAKKLFVANMVFCAVNLVAYTGISELLTSARYVLFLLMTVINAAFIYTCYMWICLPEDRDMSTKKEKRKNGKGEK